MIAIGVALAWTGAGALAGEAGTKADANADGKALRAYYFGNSLTGCSDPRWHPELAASAGRKLENWAFLGAGWQLWQHRYALRNAGVEMQRDSRGDLTIDPEDVKHPTGWNTKQFLSQRWDVIVLQPFSMSLTWPCTEMWGTKFGRETDVGDIQSADDLIDIYLSLNPEGRVLVYQNWPAMPAGEIPPADERPAWARQKGVRIARAEFPRRDQFDYEQAWAKTEYIPSPDPNRFWLKQNSRSRDYHRRLFDALKKRHAKLWRSGRLRVIPVGDIWLALHRKMKAGRFPGCEDIEDFYTDVQHIRAGLPRYSVAAAFHAALFEEHPGKLDWRLYSAQRYEKLARPDRSHDRGEHFEITAERARIVNDTIWEVINRHPDAKPGRGGKTSDKSNAGGPASPSRR
jgi:hypothetical protein